MMDDATTHADAAADLAAWGRDGDRAALERALAAAEPVARAVARARLGDPSAVEDVAQETLLQLMRSAGRYDPTRSFAAWVGHLARTACLRWRRSEGRRRRHEDRAPCPPPAGSPSERSAAADDAAVVRAALRELPGSMRGAVELHYVAGLSQRAAAEALGCSENALAVRLHRARSRLAGLLERRGVVVSSALLASALVPRAGEAAATTTATSIAAWGSQAPSTTLPLSTVQHGVVFMIQHPLISAAAGLLLAGSLGLGAAIAVEPGQDPEPVVVADEVGYFQDRARAVLQWYDSEADFRLAIDLDHLRPAALAAPPLSILGDPQAVALTDELRRVASLANGPAFVRDVLSNAHAVGYSLHDQRLAHEETRLPTQQRVLFAIAAGEATETLAAQFPQVDDAQPDLAGLTIIGRERDLLFARSDHCLVGGPAALLAPRSRAPAADPPPAPLHVVADFAGLMAAYAAATDPALGITFSGLSEVLGPRWTETRPRLSVAADVTDGAWHSEIALTGAVPIDPLDVSALLQGVGIDTDWSDFGALIADGRAFDRRYRFATRAPLVTLEAGLVLDFTDLDAHPDYWPAPLAQALRALTGDIRLVVETGAPLPTATLVCGLQPEAELADLMAMIEAEPLAARAGERARWRYPLPMPFGTVHLIQHDDRLICTTSLAPEAGTGQDADQQAPDAHIALHADLPAIWTFAQGYLPLLAAQVDHPLLPKLLAAAPAIGEHLPVWTLDWTLTPDGCVIDERGLPLAGILLAGFSHLLLDTTDIAAETEALRTLTERVRLVREHRAGVDLVRRLADHLVITDERRIDRAATLSAADVTPETIRAELPALASWTPEHTLGLLHANDLHDVEVHGFWPQTVLDPEQAGLMEASGGTTADPDQPEDYAWTLPIADGLIAHIVKDGQVLLEQAAMPEPPVERGADSF